MMLRGFLHKPDGRKHRMATSAGSDATVAADGEKGNLILELLVGKRIVIGEGRIVMTCLSSGHTGCRIAFEAPKNERVDREEVHDRRMQERAARSGLGGGK
jgi:sRNA-binding carbon storage regulator CsrA